MSGRHHASVTLPTGNYYVRLEVNRLMPIFVVEGLTFSVGTLIRARLRSVPGCVVVSRVSYFVANPFRGIGSAPQGASVCCKPVFCVCVWRCCWVPAAYTCFDSSGWRMEGVAVCY